MKLSNEELADRLLRVADLLQRLENTTYTGDGVVCLKEAAKRLRGDKYQELIMAVGKKWSGETRHETALRYIKQAEQSCCNPDKNSEIPK